MTDRRQHLVDAVRRSALTSPGALDTATRQAAAVGDTTQMPAAAAELVAKIRHQAWRITLADLDALRAVGWTEDQVFELTVAASVGAGLLRLDAGLAAIAAAQNAG
jgi:hypothetical protein